MSADAFDLATRRRAAGVSAAFGATLLFSWGTILVKGVGLPAAALSFYRLLFGAGCLSLAALALRVPWPRQWRPLLGAGLSFGVHQVIFVAATQQTSIAIVTLFVATQPLLVALLSRKTVGERVAPALLGYALIAFLGVGVVVHANWHDSSRTLQGDLLAFANTVLFTVYFLFAKRALVAGAHTLTFTAGFLALALVVVAPAMLLSAPVLPDSRQSLLLLALAMGPGNGHLLLNWAHPRISAALSSLVLSSMPLFATVWAHWFYGEPLGGRHVLGILLVGIAVEAARRTESRTTQHT
jgi:drug/metabolite transporter (DMT)-like permease